MFLCRTKVIQQLREQLLNVTKARACKFLRYGRISARQHGFVEQSPLETSSTDNVIARVDNAPPMPLNLIRLKLCDAPTQVLFLDKHCSYFTLPSRSRVF